MQRLSYGVEMITTKHLALRDHIPEIVKQVRKNFQRFFCVFV